MPAVSDNIRPIIYHPAPPPSVLEHTMFHGGTSIPLIKLLRCLFGPGLETKITRAAWLSAHDQPMVAARAVPVRRAHRGSVLWYGRTTRPLADRSAAMKDEKRLPTQAAGPGRGKPGPEHRPERT